MREFDVSHILQDVEVRFTRALTRGPREFEILESDVFDLMVLIQTAHR